MGDYMDKYLDLEDYGIAIPCIHDHVPSNSCKKLIVGLFFNICRNLVYYHKNGKRWASKQNIPAKKGSRVNPFCPLCRHEIAKFLILEKNITKHVVYQILEILNDEVWNKVLKIDKEEPNPIIEIHDHKVDGVRFAPDRVCNEEEFRAWIAKGNHAFEEEIPAIQGLESVTVDDDENVCSICLLELKNMDDKDNINDEDGTDNVNVTDDDDDGIKTMSLVKLPCKHVFHEPCVLRWLHKNHVCPFCRFQLPQSGTLVDE